MSDYIDKQGKKHEHIHVFMEDTTFGLKGWYYADETASLIGPFNNIEECEKALKDYCDNYLRPTMDKIVVTRHKALLEYLIKHEYVEPDVQHLTRARAEDVEGKHVFGILPNWLACHAGQLTELQLDLPIGKRHIELSLDDIEFHLNKKPKTYIIIEVEDDDNV